MTKEIIVFTDGSNLDNTSTETFAGIGIHFPNKELPDISLPFIIKPLTNQRAELYAIYTALHQITTKLQFDKITIYSDSEYSIKSLTVWINNWKRNNWINSKKKPIKNKDIIKEIDTIMQKYPDKIKFIHVRSHTNKQDTISIANAKADLLAHTAALKSKNIK